MNGRNISECKEWLERDLGRLASSSSSSSTSSSFSSWNVDCLDILWFKQSGPSCGLVALQFASSVTLNDDRDAHLLQALREKASSFGCSCEFTRDWQNPDPKKTELSLLQYARSLGLTRDGEMFCAASLAELGRRYYGSECLLLDNWTKEDVCRAVRAGCCILVPYDRDGNSLPCLKQGKKAHWAVIHGIAARRRRTTATANDAVSYQYDDSKGKFDDDDDSMAVICSHGMSKRPLVCLMNDIKASCANLRVSSAEVGMVVPHDGMHLANTAIVVVPKAILNT